MVITYYASKTKARIWKEITCLWYRELLRCTSTIYEICMKTFISNL